MSNLRPITLKETQVEGSSETHTTLFDTGPESRSIVRNMAALKINPERIKRIVLSHWHSDHSGGILSVLRQRNMEWRPSPSSNGPTPCVVDLHPDRPVGRGIMPPGTGKVAARLAPDPTFEEIEALGAKVETRADGHAVADGAVWVSGEIPRVTEYEKGLLGGVRWVQGVNQGKGEWVSEPVIDS